MKSNRAPTGTLTVDAAAAAAPHLELQGVAITRVSAARIGERTAGQLFIELPVVNVQWQTVGDTVKAMFPFIVNIFTGTLDGQRHVTAEIALDLRLDYAFRSAENRPDGDDLASYVGVSGFMHAWPYLRAEVQSLTAKIALPPLTLPVMLTGEVPDRVTVTRLVALSEPDDAVQPESARKLPSSKPAKAGSKRKKTPARTA